LEERLAHTLQQYNLHNRATKAFTDAPGQQHLKLDLSSLTQNMTLGGPKSARLPRLPWNSAATPTPPSTHRAAMVSILSDDLKQKRIVLSGRRTSHVSSLIHPTPKPQELKEDNYTILRFEKDHHRDPWMTQRSHSTSPTKWSRAGKLQGTLSDTLHRSKNTHGLTIQTPNPHLQDHPEMGRSPRTLEKLQPPPPPRSQSVEPPARSQSVEPPREHPKLHQISIDQFVTNEELQEGASLPIRGQTQLPSDDKNFCPAPIINFRGLDGPPIDSDQLALRSGSPNKTVSAKAFTLIKPLKKQIPKMARMVPPKRRLKRLADPLDGMSSWDADSDDEAHVAKEVMRQFEDRKVGAMAERLAAKKDLNVILAQDKTMDYLVPKVKPTSSDTSDSLEYASDADASGFTDSGMGTPVIIM